MRSITFTPMRHSVSTFLLALAYTLVLVPDTVHVPALVGHYLDHKERTPDLGVMEFLALHYADKEHTDSHDRGHDQLPFHHHHPGGDILPTMVLMVAMPQLHMPYSPLPTPVAHGDDDPLAGHRHGLIQPPRC